MKEYTDYLMVYCDLMRQTDHSDSIWGSFAKALTDNLEPFSLKQFEQGGKALKNNIKEYCEVYHDSFDR